MSLGETRSWGLQITEIPKKTNKNTINTKIFSESSNFSREFNSIYLFSD